MIPANVGQTFLSAAGFRSCLHFWILDSDFWILFQPPCPSVSSVVHLPFPPFFPLTFSAPSVAR